MNQLSFTHTNSYLPAVYGYGYVLEETVCGTFQEAFYSTRLSDELQLSLKQLHFRINDKSPFHLIDFSRCDCQSTKYRMLRNVRLK